MSRFRGSVALVVAVFCGLTCVATVVMWVRSYRGPDFVKYTSPNAWFLGVTSGHGTIDVLYIPTWTQDPEFRTGRYPDDVYYGTRYSKRFLGFGTGVIRPELADRYVNIPHWFVASASGVTGILLTRSWHRRRRRHVAGRCRTCGYDLRATPDRCPECGTAASPAG